MVPHFHVALHDRRWEFGVCKIPDRNCEDRVLASLCQYKVEPQVGQK